MPYLLRVELPDVPGSLGRLASAIGEAGGDIQAIEIVEKHHGGTAVDDVFLEMEPGSMPDSVVSTLNTLAGVRVLWIGRYAAAGNLFLDLEAVEELTDDPESALDRLIDRLPVVFRADWGARVSRADGVVYATGAAPQDLTWQPIERAAALESADENNIFCGARLNKSEIVVIGRRGGPEFLDSEIARLGHLAGLAMSISRAARADR
ncbi:ACT domain-containing protein [Nocardioides sp.]|uniref:ACT domain-containing protein n=1 Tax=Nocardioides sp. TaxID=35761 RepID=UPI002ED9EE68